MVAGVAVEKDTGDIVEKILILKAALLTNLVHSLQKQHLALWPVMLQQHHHMAE